MGCVFSLPEDRRDAAERSVKVFDLLRPLRHNKRFFLMILALYRHKHFSQLSFNPAV